MKAEKLKALLKERIVDLKENLSFLEKQPGGWSEINRTKELLSLNKKIYFNLFTLYELFDEDKKNG